MTHEVTQHGHTGIHRQGSRGASDDPPDEAFNGEACFGPITVEATPDSYGEYNLEIVVVYENSSQLLDPHKLDTISPKLGMILLKLDFHNIPTESYIDKSEYAEWLELNGMQPWQKYEL